MGKHNDLKGKNEVVKRDPRQPGIPHCHNLSSNTVTLIWEKPQLEDSKILRYRLQYKIDGKKKWYSVDTESNKNCFSINDLQSKTIYVFRVRAIFDADGADDDDDDDDVESCFSTPSQNIKTKQSPSEAILTRCKKERRGEIDVYKLPLQIDRDSINRKAKSRKCVFGDPQPIYSEEKTIMIVGETGTGKSTLINGMVNYILGVQWEDNWRFDILDLVKEEETRLKDQTTSQTEWITCYTIFEQEGGPLGYTLNIIDTPGFGDTRGIERDKEIVRQIDDLFNTKGAKGVQDLDAVCFVAKASDVRLTKTQQYIFDQILSIFGKDIENNVFILITFTDDDKNPNVIEALRAAKVPYQAYFLFNNKALFPTQKASLGHEYWKIGKENYAKFFSSLRQTEKCSLQQSANVLKTRKNLEVKIQAMQQEIRKQMEMIEQIQQLEGVIKAHEADINLNKAFTYEVDEHHSIKVDLLPGEHVTNCTICHNTCHVPCAIPKNDDKNGCAAMKDGNCTICALKCNWMHHINDTYRVDYKTVKVTKESKELKERFQKALGEAQTHSDMLKHLKDEQDEHKKGLYNMTQEARGYINHLNRIALKHDPLSEVEYLQMLIQGEMKQGKPGFQKRIELYEDMKQQAETIKRLPEKDYSPLQITEK